MTFHKILLTATVHSSTYLQDVVSACWVRGLIGISWKFILNPTTGLPLRRNGCTGPSRIKLNGTVPSANLTLFKFPHTARNSDFSETGFPNQASKKSNYFSNFVPSSLATFNNFKNPAPLAIEYRAFSAKVYVESKHRSVTKMCHIKSNPWCVNQSSEDQLRLLHLPESRATQAPDYFKMQVQLTV